MTCSHFYLLLDCRWAFNISIFLCGLVA